MRSGFICIAGMPNAGKSTLINALVGEKVAIVSWRPQTTRNKILGVVNTDDAQIVFIDTPGIHQAKNKLGKYMMQSVASGMKDVDGVIYVLDAAKGVREEDETFLTERAESVPVIVALNKQDAVTRDTLFAVLDKLNAFRAVKAVVPVSAKKGENLEPLLAEAEKLLPEGEKMYPDDMYTDRTMRFMAAEIIREKLFLQLRQEVPYCIAVEVEHWEEDEQRGQTVIHAVIYVARPMHKGMVIGKGGKVLKQVGMEARKDIQELLGGKVHLELWVKVRENWTEDPAFVQEMTRVAEVL